LERRLPDPVCRLKHTEGLYYPARLLQNAERKLHAEVAVEIPLPLTAPYLRRTRTEVISEIEHLLDHHRRSV
jgi:hypothetical protein